MRAACIQAGTIAAEIRNTMGGAKRSGELWAAADFFRLSDALEEEPMPSREIVKEQHRLFRARLHHRFKASA